MKLSERTITDILNLYMEGYPQHVHDYGVEYGEPGYGTADTTFVVLGDYWCRCTNGPDKEDPRPLHGVEYHHPRLWQQMADQGVEFEWYDEWMIDHEGGGKAYRTQGDSYSWMPSVVFNDDDCEWMAPDSDIEYWIEWAKNDPSRCLLERVHSPGDLENAGFKRGTDVLETGWHEGMDADPHKALDALFGAHPDEDIEVVFLLEYNSQFYSGWSAWVRPIEND